MINIVVNKQNTGMKQKGNYRWMDSVKMLLLKPEEGICKPIVIATENAGHKHFKKIISDI